ncbi:hypothetical protein ZTR_03637 [Talaromyces verruculosus]|nr:hypothetical protein ZTR_03637 [Talaromyces verruculosus]
MAAVKPLYGQASDIFGTRILLMLSIAMFTLGSGLCGGASNTAVIIAGRAVQGLGGGGLFVMVSIIVADLVPLRERQKYMSMIMDTFVGTIIGGAIASKISWRWVFYINLPIAGVAFVLVIVFLRVHYRRDGTLWSRLARLDMPGNMLLMSSVTAVLIGLTWGGTLYIWKSCHVLLPLLIDIVGLVVFLFHQKFFAVDPTMLLRVYSNNTSLLSFILTFLHGIEMSRLSFFLPIHFQVLVGANPIRSGVDLLAIVIPLMSAGIVGGFIVGQTGQYKPTMISGYATLAIGAGCLTILHASLSTAKWVIFQIITGVRGVLALTATLPAVQAPLAEADVAIATASWGFARAFGSIWGPAIPTAVFNLRIDNLQTTISDPIIQAILTSGAVKQELIDIYTKGVKEVWQVLTSFAVIAVPIAVVIKEAPLRTELVTEFGLTGDEKEEMKLAQVSGVRL